MERNFYVQPLYYVGEDEHTIAVAESADVVMYSCDEDYFGQFRFDMPVEFMRMLAKTILKVCDEVEAKRK